MHDQRSPWLMVALGVAIALTLIALGGMNDGFGSPELMRRFAAQPPAPGDLMLNLPRIEALQAPPDLLRALDDLHKRLSGGQAAPALTPTVASPRIEVRVSNLHRNGEQLIVRGSVRNLADQEVTIPPGAFSFRDSRGVRYAAAASAAAALAPGATTDFEFSVPLPEGRGLTLIFDLPPDPPLEQTLLLEVAER
ncbi:MAG: hypothetical protein NZ699_04105 [Roseiflexus sp.]|nr:hypothetical protein [Roseiflexus sp.]MCS7288297.1 hypothetical protein [Roseiflexus sp.]MDW8148909.1 hypothetical protein [Roseiflexaceae bacterium]MDW8233443.1 hypothetical protein [Roseiflexaceae bacterium]